MTKREQQERCPDCGAAANEPCWDDPHPTSEKKAKVYKKARIATIRFSVQINSESGLNFSEVAKIIEDKLGDLCSDDWFIRKLHSISLGPLEDFPEKPQEDE